MKDKLLKAGVVIFTTFAREGEKGLNVSEMRELKRELRGIDSEYLIGKKTLLDKTLAEGKKDIDVFQCPGSMGMVFGYGDEAAIARSVYNFAKKNPALKYFGAFWNGRFMDLAEFTEFAKLPTKEVMIARLLGMLMYPVSALAIVLNQISKNKN